MDFSSWSALNGVQHGGICNHNQLDLTCRPSFILLISPLVRTKNKTSACLTETVRFTETSQRQPCPPVYAKMLQAVNGVPRPVGDQQVKTNFSFPNYPILAAGTEHIPLFNEQAVITQGRGKSNKISTWLPTITTFAMSRVS